MANTDTPEVRLTAREEFLQRAEELLGDAGTGPVPGMLPCVYNAPGHNFPNTVTLQSKAACLHQGKPYILNMGINLQSIYYFCGGYIAFGGKATSYSPVTTTYGDGGWMFREAIDAEKWLRLPRIEAYLGRNWMDITADDREKVPGLPRSLGPQWGMAKNVARMIIGKAASNSKGIVTFWDRSTSREPGHLHIIGLAAKSLEGQRVGWYDAPSLGDWARFATSPLRPIEGMWEGTVQVANVELGEPVRNPNSGNQVRQTTIYLSGSEPGGAVASASYQTLGGYVGRHRRLLGLNERDSVRFDMGAIAPGIGIGWVNE